MPAFEPLSKFPSIRRDFAVVVNRDVAVGEILEAARKAAPAVVKDVQLSSFQRALDKMDLTIVLTRYYPIINDDDDNNPSTKKLEVIAEDEVKAMLRSPLAAKDVDILKCHVRRDTRVVTRVALDYLATPASSSPSERANSLAARVWQNRSRLSDEMFMAEVCVRSWIKTIQKMGGSIPTDISSDYHALKKTTCSARRRLTPSSTQ